MTNKVRPKTKTEKSTIPTKPTGLEGMDMSDMSAVIDKSVALEKEQDAETLQLAQYLGFEHYVYDESFAMKQVQHSQASAAEELMKLGAWLIIIKNNCAHGEFGNKLKELSIHKSDAQRFMKAVKKLGNFKNRYVADFTKSQIFELLSLPDDQLEELAEGGEASGNTLDELANLTVRELRAEVRTLRKLNSTTRESEQQARNEMYTLEDKVAQYETSGHKNIQKVTQDLSAQIAIVASKISQNAIELQAFYQQYNDLIKSGEVSIKDNDALALAFGMVCDNGYNQLLPVLEAIDSIMQPALNITTDKA